MIEPRSTFFVLRGFDRESPLKWSKTHKQGRQMT
jgi:hypothetical protein